MSNLEHTSIGVEELDRRNGNCLVRLSLCNGNSVQTDSASTVPSGVKS